MVVVSAMDELVRKSVKREAKPDDMEQFRVGSDGKIASTLSVRGLTAQKWFVLLDQKVQIGPISLDLLDFRAKRTISVTVRLRMLIPKPGEQALESLAKSNSMPKETVRSWVKGLMQSEIEKHQTEDVAVWIALNANTIESGIVKLLKEKGFEAEAKIETDELPDNTMVIATESFTVRPRDVDWSLPISIGMRLDHSGTAKIKPPANETDWRRTIKSIARDYVERNESLDDVRQHNKFAKRLEKHIGEACADFGWKVDRLELTSDLSEFDKELSDTFETQWKSHSGRIFAFKTKVELSIAQDGAANYLKAKQPALRAWVTDNLKSCFDSILFERDSDALNPSNFSEVDAQLRQRLAELAKPVGFKIGLVLVEPAIPEWKYLTTRQFEIGEENYGTTNPDKDAEFSMVIEGKFPSVGPTFKASQGNESIDELIRKTAIQAARHVMKSTELQDYISHFDAFDERLRGDTLRDEPVLAELKREIAAQLKSQLNFSLSSLKVRKIDQEIREKLAQLYREEPKEFSVNVLYDMDLEKGVRPEELMVPFALVAEFAQPDRKDVVNLALRELDPDRLWENIKGWTKTALDGLSYDDLLCDTPQSKNKLINTLNREVGAKLSLRGVGIDFTSIDRGISQLEAVENYAVFGSKIEESQHARDIRQIERNHEKTALTEELEQNRELMGYLSDAQREAIKTNNLSYDETVHAIDEAKQRQRRENAERVGIASDDTSRDQGPEEDASQKRKKKNQYSEDDN